MKECCKTGDEPVQNNYKKYFKAIIYIVLIAIVAFAVIESITQ
jgi:hypothetical protein